MKIEGSPKGIGAPPAADSRSRAAPTNSAPTGGAAKVELSNLSATLSRADAAIASTPVVDRARVDEIRQAISEGRFQVNAERIADGLIDSARQMIDAQSA